MAQVTVTGQIRKFDQSGDKNEKVYFKVNQSTNPYPTGDHGQKEIKTDSNGDFSIDLEEEILYVVRIPSIPVTRTIKIPAGTVGPIDIFDFWHAEDTGYNFFGDQS